MASQCPSGNIDNTAKAGFTAPTTQTHLRRYNFVQSIVPKCLEDCCPLLPVGDVALAHLRSFSSDIHCSNSADPGVWPMSRQLCLSSVSRVSFLLTQPTPANIATNNRIVAVRERGTTKTIDSSFPLVIGDTSLRLPSVSVRKLSESFESVIRGGCGHCNSTIRYPQ